MTFADKLRELIKRGDGSAGFFLANHAKQIEALVRAAHSAHQTLVDEGFHAKAIRLGQALAALEKEQP